MNEPTPWARYVVSVARTVNSTEIARRTGINQSSVYRWLKEGSEPKPAHAAKVAQTYGSNPLRAFVAAGWLLESEVDHSAQPEIPPLEHHSVDELLRIGESVMRELASRVGDNFLDRGQATESERAELNLVREVLSDDADTDWPLAADDTPGRDEEAEAPDTP